MTYRNSIKPRGHTPQTVKADPRQKQNESGGFTFEVDNWVKLRRWLYLGAEGGSYYASQEDLVKQASKSLEACLKEDGFRTLQIIQQVSQSKTAPKNEPAIFALAYALVNGTDTVKQQIAIIVPYVCRTGTHILHFAAYLKALGTGWGRSVKRAVASWYEKPPESLAYQLLKYQSRDGFSHKDVIALTHIRKDAYGTRKALIDWAWDGNGLPEVPIFIGWQKAKAATTEKEVAAIVREYKLTREMIPTQWLNKPVVQEALFEDMPMTALLRNLGNLTASGLIATGTAIADEVARRFENEELVRKAGLHPFNIMLAYKTYHSGRGFRGDNTWRPVPKVMAALDRAYALAFQNVKPTGKNILLAVDHSASMHIPVNNTALQAHEVGALMAAIFLRTEPDAEMISFATHINPMAVHQRSSLDDIVRALPSLGEGTDLSLPVQYAMQQTSRNVDAILMYTDSVTWAGNRHPHEVAAEYRRKRNPNLKIVNCAMTYNGWTTGDPDDAQFFEVTGMDSSVPGIVSEFLTGTL